MAVWDATRHSIANAYFSLQIEPRHGGRITSLTASAGELTVGAADQDLDRRRVPHHFGLLSTQLWQDSYWHNDLNRVSWPISAASTSPEGIVAVTLAGQSSLWPGVNVQRTVRVDDQPWIDVLNVLDPGPSATTYMAPAFWFSNVMHERGRGFASGPYGVLEYPRFPGDQSWCQEPSRGWIAWANADAGLALTTELDHLRHVRFRHAPHDRLEWIRRRVATRQTATVRLIPFTGVPHVAGVGDAGVVGLSGRAGEQQCVEGYALLSGVASLIFSVDTGGTTESVATLTDISVSAGNTFTVPLPSEAIATLTLGRMLQVALEVASGDGVASTHFQIHPAVPREPLRSVLPDVRGVQELPRAEQPQRKPPRDFQFDAAPVELSTPWVSRRSSRPRVLALVMPTNTATILDLARAFDLDLTLPFMPYSAAQPQDALGIANQHVWYQLGDRYESLDGQELVDAWTSSLSAGHAYDVLFLEMYNVDQGWPLLPETLQTEILRRVSEDGTGLVVIRRGAAYGAPSSVATAQMNGALPLAVVNEHDWNGPLLHADDRAVRGLPWPIMGSSGHVMQYAPRAGAEVLVSIAPDPHQPSFPVVARGTYGAGRILDVAWGPSVVPPDAHRTFPATSEGLDLLRYDEALIARLIQDAAARVPPIAVRNVSLAGTTATVELELNGGSSVPCQLAWSARDRFGALLGSDVRSVEVAPPTATIDFAIPAGVWTVDVSVQPAGGDNLEPAWGAGAQMLDLPVTFSLPAGSVDRTDRIQVRVPVGGTVGRFVADVVDGRGRVVEREREYVGGSVNLPLDNVDTPYAAVRVHAFGPGQELAGQAVRAFRLRGRTVQPTWPVHFSSRAWPLPRRLLMRHLEAEACMGISAYYLSGAGVPDDDLVAAANRLGIPYAVATSSWLMVSGGQSADGQGDPLSLTDGETIALGRARDRAAAEALDAANVLFYRVDKDEPPQPYTDTSFDARTLERFQTWLAHEYRHADSALQAEWGSAVNLSTARPGPYADTMASFPAGGTYAAWVDFRRFMMQLFSAAPAEARSALRASDPGALTATSGDRWTSSALGRDWWTRGKALDIVGRYAISTAFELAALGTRALPWTAYDDPDPFIQHRLWTILGLGEAGVALFAEPTLINPDLTLPEVGRDLASALVPVRRGLGDLFAASEPADDGIFVLVSPDSSVVLGIHGYENIGSWKFAAAPVQADLGTESREGVHALLAAMGVGWRAMSPAEVEKGDLELRGARILILPLCAALSDSACDAIRRWVSHGGALVADLMPAIFTNHGRLRGEGITPEGLVQNPARVLDAVLGVAPAARPRIATTPVSVTVGAASFHSLCQDTVAAVTSSSVVSGGSTDVARLWFSNASGRGRAAYLGCSLFADYMAATRSDRTAIENAFAQLLASIGARPRAQAVTMTAERVELCQFRVRTLGAAELVVVLRDYAGVAAPVAPEVDGQLRLDAPAHVYDLADGVYLGLGQTLDVRVGASTFRAFVRLPYRVVGIDVRAHPIRLGDTLEVEATIRTSGEGTVHGHYLRLDVLDGCGTPLRYLARVAAADASRGGFMVHTAYNDSSGPWRAIVTDLMTGVTGQCAIDVWQPAAAAPSLPPFQIDSIDD